MLSDAHKEAIRKAISDQGSEATKKDKSDNFFHYTDNREPICNGYMVSVKGVNAIEARREEWMVLIINYDTYIVEKQKCRAKIATGTDIARFNIDHCTRVQYHVLTEDVAKSNAEIVKLKSQLSASESLKSETTTLGKEIANLKSQLSAMESIREENVNLKMAIDSRDNNAVSAVEIASMESETIALREENANLNVAMANRDNDAVKMEEEIATLQSKLSTANEKLHVSESIGGEQMMVIASLREEIANLKRKRVDETPNHDMNRPVVNTPDEEMKTRECDRCKKELALSYFLSSSNRRNKEGIIVSYVSTRRSCSACKHKTASESSKRTKTSK